MWLRDNQSNQDTLLWSVMKIKKTLLNTADSYHSTGKHYPFNIEYFVIYFLFTQLFLSSRFTRVLIRKNGSADLQVTVVLTFNIQNKLGKFDS